MSNVKVSLTISDGPDKGQSFDLKDGTNLVGRNRGEIKLTDKKASGRHCQFILENNRVYLEDLGSTNGTFMGAHKVGDRLELHNLDVVTVGLSKLTIAIVEDVKKFKEINANDYGEIDFNPDETAPEAGQFNPVTPIPVAAPKETKMPADDAIYRETGVNRIQNLIEDELQAFSKWDHPATAEKSGPHSVPKVQVVLNARKAPEGVSRITCSQEKTTIGRKEVDIRINDLDLSRKHAAIEIVGGRQAYVRDLASTNGTFVNGNRVTFQEIKQGDLVQFGQCVFEVFIQTIEK